jgi:hypothetical protein
MATLDRYRHEHGGVEPKRRPAQHGDSPRVPRQHHCLERMIGGKADNPAQFARRDEAGAVFQHLKQIMSVIEPRHEMEFRSDVIRLAKHREGAERGELGPDRQRDDGPVGKSQHKTVQIFQIPPSAKP